MCVCFREYFEHVTRGYLQLLIPFQVLIWKQLGLNPLHLSPIVSFCYYILSFLGHYLTLIQVLSLYQIYLGRFINLNLRQVDHLVLDFCNVSEEPFLSLNRHSIVVQHVTLILQPTISKIESSIKRSSLGPRLVLVLRLTVLAASSIYAERLC